MQSARRIAVIAVGLALLAACSDSGGQGAATSLDAKTEGQIEATTTSTVPDITDIEHQPATGEFVGALADIGDHTCEQTVDGWRVTGTATNPTTANADYRIYISLVSGVGQTRALVEVEVLKVVPDGSGSFDTVIALSDTDVRCVLRVERRRAEAD